MLKIHFDFQTVFQLHPKRPSRAKGQVIPKHQQRPIQPVVAAASFVSYFCFARKSLRWWFLCLRLYRANSAVYNGAFISRHTKYF